VNVSFNTDFEIEGDEQLIVNFASGENGGVNGGINAEHVITITESNVAPEISLSIMQNGIHVSTIAKDGGEAVINLAIVDSNINDTHVIDWQLPDYLSAEVSGNQLQVFISPDTIILPSDVQNLIEISVTVTDSGNTNNSGSESLTQTKYLAIPLIESQPRLTESDTDRDGVSDLTEGFSDNDFDGLPEFLDISTIPYLLPLHVNSALVKLVETEPGLHLVLGKYARLQYSDGAQLSQQEIDDTNLIVADDLTHQGDYFDFEIHKIQPFGRSVFIVIPLSQAIVEYSVYRKFSKENGWQDFTLDANNAIASSETVNGVCPAPHSELYQEGLIIGSLCLRLFIEDGGANDSDAIANGVVDDPGGMALIPNSIIVIDKDPEKSSSGSISYLLLLGLLLILLRRYYRNKV